MLFHSRRSPAPGLCPVTCPTGGGTFLMARATGAGLPLPVAGRLLALIKVASRGSAKRDGTHKLRRGAFRDTETALSAHTDIAGRGAPPGRQRAPLPPTARRRAGYRARPATGRPGELRPRAATVPPCATASRRSSTSICRGVRVRNAWLWIYSHVSILLATALSGYTFARGRYLLTLLLVPFALVYLYKRYEKARRYKVQSDTPV